MINIDRVLDFIRGLWFDHKLVTIVALTIAAFAILVFARSCDAEEVAANTTVTATETVGNTQTMEVSVTEEAEEQTNEENVEITE